MWYCWLQFHHVLGDVVVERGGVGGMGGIVGECVNHSRCHHQGVHWLCREGYCSVGVQLRRDVFARMGEAPSRQVGLGVGWQGGEGVRPVGTSISHLMLRGSSFGESRGGQCGLKVRLGKGGGDSRP
jgi:hypothetical protein